MYPVFKRKILAKKKNRDIKKVFFVFLWYCLLYYNIDDHIKHVWVHIPILKKKKYLSTMLLVFISPEALF